MIDFYKLTEKSTDFNETGLEDPLKSALPAAGLNFTLKRTKTCENVVKRFKGICWKQKFNVNWRSKSLLILMKLGRFFKMRSFNCQGWFCKSTKNHSKPVPRTTAMRAQRPITGRTLLNRVKSAEIRTECQVPDVVRWSWQRRREWNERVQRMEDSRLTKKVSNNNPRGHHLPGRP